MKSLKLIVSAVLSFIVIGLFTVPVHAEFNEYVLGSEDFTDKEVELMLILRKNIAERSNDIICVSDYGVDRDRFEYLYGKVYFNSPDFFYANAAYGNFANVQKKLYFRPSYGCTESERKSRQKEIDKVTKEVLSLMDDDMSDEEKLLVVHDWLVSNVKYYDEKSTFLYGRDIYETLVNKKAICVGFSITFEYFCDLLDIPCITVSNDTHIWNMVMLDKKWYYVDVTWDLDLDYQPHFGYHWLFLVSEETFNKNMDHGEYNINYDSEEDSPYYDFLSTIFCTMTYIDGNWYYMLPKGLYEGHIHNMDTAYERVVSSTDEIWTSPEGEDYFISFGKVVKDGDTVIFTTKSAVKRYDPDKNEASTLYNLSSSKGSIYDIRVDKDKITVLYGKDAYKKPAALSFKTKTSVKTATSSKKEKDDDPIGLMVTKTDSSIKLSWNEIDNAEQYIVYRIDERTKKAAKLLTTADTSVTLKRSSKNDNAVFAVRFRTSSGVSGYYKAS